MLKVDASRIDRLRATDKVFEHASEVDAIYELLSEMVGDKPGLRFGFLGYMVRGTANGYRHAL